MAADQLLSRTLNPRSIALFGASPAQSVIEQCQKLGFTGQLWPVHPTRDSIAGVKCFKSIADLPGAPDVAFIAVNRNATIDVVAGLAKIGSGGAVCYASGFAESGTQLKIELQRYSNEGLVTISDDGVGLPEDFDLLTSANLGLQIVRTLTENELQGELKLESTAKGTQAKLRFPL